MYKIYVRPHLEYCIEIWNPTYKMDVQKMEKVQNKMTKLLKHGHVMTPEDRNASMGLTSHKER